MKARREFTHKRPIDGAFYDRLRLDVASRELTGEAHVAPEGAGMIVEAPAGSLVSFELPEGAQIVNVFFWSREDPDERYWAEETMLLDGAYLQRRMRLWSTMARFRPMATVVEDEVTTLRRPGEPQAFHHFAHGGSGTPADWRIKGGRPGVATSWERLTGAMESVGVPGRLMTENVSLFQKTAIDPSAQHITILPSDALPGDRMIWFAEIDLVLAVAASPYGPGGSSPAEVDGSTRPVMVRVEPGAAEPLGWPYPDVEYPDLSLYLDPVTGRRSTVVGPTPGIGEPA